MALPASDAFTGSVGPLSASWTQQRAATASVQLTGSGTASTNTGNAEGYAFWNADAFTDDQSSEADCANMSNGAQYCTLIVRAQGTTDATRDNYEVYTDTVAGGGHTEILKRVNGSGSTLKTIAGIPNGSRVTIRATGTTSTLVEVLVGGAAHDSVTDVSGFTGGAAGISTYGVATLDNWAGDNVGGGGGDPEGSLLGGKLIRGGLLRHGVLLRC